MSLSIKNIPDTYAFVEHGLLCEIQSTMSWDAPVNASIDLLFPDSQPAYNLKYFEVEAVGRIMRFYFTYTPNDDGEQLMMWDAADSKAQFLAQTIIWLNKNYYILSNYTIQLLDANAGLRLIAREPGAAFSISFVESNITDFSFANETPGTESSIPADYRVLLALQHNGQVIGQELAPINPEGIAAADFKSYVSDMVVASLVFPHEANVRAVEGAALALQLLYAESYDEAIRQLKKSDIFYAIPGGLGERELNILNQTGLGYFDDLDMGTRFLNWAPDDKLTAAHIPERLYMLHTVDSNIVVKATVYFNNNTSQTFTLGTMDQQHVIYEIACGLLEIDDTIATDNVEKWEVYGMLGAERATDVATFLLDTKTYYRNRVFFFKNSFGVYESLRCTGELSISDNIIREEYETIDQRVYRVKVHRSENNAKFKLHTGWLPNQQHRDWLQDFTLSKEVLWLHNGYLIPVVLTNADYPRKTDKQFNYGLSFEFKLDVRPERYSNIIGSNAHLLRDEDWIIVEDELGISLAAF